MNNTVCTSGCISLTTDFGQQAPFVGLVHAVIIKRFPAAKIIDLSHSIPAYAIASAGFCLQHAWAYFPAGTVHLAVVDPGVGTDRRILLAQTQEHIFVAPDNGLLPYALANAEEVEYRVVDVPRVLRLWSLPQPSATFHGRDIMAPIVAELAAGRCYPAQLGEVITDTVVLATPPAEQDRVVGQVIFIDNYGNLITDIAASTLQGFTNPIIECAGLRLSLKHTYAAAAPNTSIALINSFQVLEIAYVQGNAAQSLGIGIGERVTVRE